MEENWIVEPSWLTFKNGCWRTVTSSVGATPPEAVHIITWNVDFVEDDIPARMNCVIEHIKDVQHSEGSDNPCVILLQEVDEDALASLHEHEWVRDNFNLVGASTSDWPNEEHYGNITLVSHSLPVTNVSSLVFANSRMNRFALMVDTELRGGLRFRIANVHLESPMAFESRMDYRMTKRPDQLRAVVEEFKASGLDGALVCGDMNAYRPGDQELPGQLGLIDAYRGPDMQQHTWGHVQRFGIFPSSRPDKVLHSDGGMLYSVSSPTMIGQDLEVCTRDGLNVLVSDHYGLHAILRVYSETSINRS